jgi:hypothetical protein
MKRFLTVFLILIFEKIVNEAAATVPLTLIKTANLSADTKLNYNPYSTLSTTTTTSTKSNIVASGPGELVASILHCFLKIFERPSIWSRKFF